MPAPSSDGEWASERDGDWTVPHYSSSDHPRDYPLLAQGPYHQPLTTQSITYYMAEIRDVSLKHDVPCIAWNLTSDDHLEIDGDGVWPGQLAVLLPPPLHHERHVEAEQEGDGHARALCAAPPAGVGGGYKRGSDTDNWICTRDHPSIAHQRFALSGLLV